jgi:hypothetical protein
LQQQYQAREKSGSENFELAPRFKENLSCPSTDIHIKKHLEKDGWIRMWILQVSIPSCDRSVFSTELICMNCDASCTEVTSHGLDDKVSLSSGSRDLSLCHYIQTSHGSHSSSYPMVRYRGFLSLEWSCQIMYRTMHLWFWSYDFLSCTLIPSCIFMHGI